jgi:hypothetical protein
MKKSLIFSFGLIGEIGFVVSIPLLSLGLLGRYFDHKLDTGPYLFLAGIAIATIIIYLTVKSIVSKAIKNFESK